MPLDASLFVLSLVPRLDKVGCVDIKEDGSTDAHYVAQKDVETGTISLIDPWTDTKWASLTPTVPNKLKLVEFFNPEHSEEFKNTGKLGWQWSWEWEGVKYAWDRSGSFSGDKSYTLEVLRKPDPNFPICLYTPASKKKAAQCQILDYNLARIEPPIKDRKGLEVMTLLSLLSLLSTPQFDMFGIPPTPTEDASSTSDHPVKASIFAAVAQASSSAPGPKAPANAKSSTPTNPSIPPPVPPMPPRSSSVQTLSTNEIEVRDIGKADKYSVRALDLLKDDGLLFLVLLGSGPVVPHVVALAEKVKRQRYKTSGEELMQYIDDGGAELSSLDKYATPSSIKVYLSRIEMRDILPNYKPRHAKKPDLRPPIVFGSSSAKSSGPAAASAESSAVSKKTPVESENGGGGGLFARFGF
ncbi:BQ5605_C042g12043 [Microbotryum silenes-dioicae]|uniref:BQ5605_C042g12043 protein n=1 Tax=Microbotryum silenes-dioicae TaxID=796604 RepID=A0A2X0MQN6_9BASI|nr:BQ5605_C042g12043 [Microbotryum silenes-dioicae]